ncbi:DENN domain-containing protein 5B [Myotis davidii]|uniref:DENN domain-containing protein 5B n=1 Tax=Myotis davidii TaxID=225400 RepID=L5LHJ1_MYODS|nr:DENN domain-containing protein 5B [Myotis davidii]
MRTDHQGADTQRRSCPLVVSAHPQWEHRSADKWAPAAGLTAVECSCGGVSLSCGHSPCMPKCGHSGGLSRARMSRSGAAPSPGLGSSPAACRFSHYFVLCRIDTDSKLEPDELAGEAGLRRRRSPLILQARPRDPTSAQIHALSL